MIDALEIEREKILIVGDNTDVRDLIATLFGATHVILTAHSGKTGLAMAITETPDLILLDVKMPDMVSVELNGDILDRENFDSTNLSENDEIEFLYFMGGGQ